MKVQDLIQLLQRLDPNKDVLVESDTGLPWACRGARNDVWVEDDGTETPVVVILADS
jgi:3'-phosphoadenosine 5'-phosphosulfate (PAPS) 3'-phosphatase